MMMSSPLGLKHLRFLLGLVAASEEFGRSSSSEGFEGGFSVLRCASTGIGSESRGTVK